VRRGLGAAGVLGAVGAMALSLSFSPSVSRSRAGLRLDATPLAHAAGKGAAGTPATAAPSPLVGLWEARLRLGPDVRGPLQLTQHGGVWRAEIAGRAATITVTGDALRAQLPDDEGAFVGHFAADKSSVRGHWIQPATVANNTRYASPVVLMRSAAGQWRGQVVPLDDVMTLYLVIQPRADGTLGVFLRNPERNVGHFVNLDHVELHGEDVKLVGHDPKGPTVHGSFRDGMLSITIAPLGGTYDFRRVAAADPSDFYPRGRPTVPYVYVPPPPRDDGWPTATPEDVGLSRAALGRFMQLIIDTPMDSIHAPEIHGVLVARHGKLVLEEYFHGEHRDKPHDTRSASKSLTSTLIGAAVQAKLPIAAATPVYAAFDGAAAAAAQSDPHKRALTVENLITMSSGLDCDDRDPKSAGNEDRLWDEHPADFYRYTLDLKSVRAPGERAVYCSASANLAGGVLAKTTGRPLIDLFGELLADPLHIDRYWMNLMPNGDAYMGGGIRFLPRDFMKLGQLFLDGGKWHGRRIVSEDWVRRATSPLRDLQKLRYGYLWWIIEYPYRGHNVRAFFAGGNGGQLVMVLPELDLVVCIWGGNYSDPVFYDTQQKYVPQYLLPAVDAP
jgi:CubicO group peptidase (beta-lactamase class C family)